MCSDLYGSTSYYPMNIFTLTLTECPDSPANVTAFNFGAHWVALRWTPTVDGNRPVTSFELYVSAVDVSDNFITIGSRNAIDLMTSEGRFMYNISDMDVILPFTNYSFTVVSCNVIGCSNQSEPSAVIETDQESKICSRNNNSTLHVMFGYIHPYNSH